VRIENPIARLVHNETMLAKVCSAAINGIEAYPVEVEVNVGYGDTIIVIVVNRTPKPFCVPGDRSSSRSSTHLARIHCANRTRHDNRKGGKARRIGFAMSVLECETAASVCIHQADGRATPGARLPNFPRDGGRIIFAAGNTLVVPRWRR
jgi:hypothetical protein